MTPVRNWICQCGLCSRYARDLPILAALASDVHNRAGYGRLGREAPPVALATAVQEEHRLYPSRPTRLTNEKAPCGQAGDGERFRDRDDECLLRGNLFYNCGCQSIHHEYHDGSLSLDVVRHDGTVLEDGLIYGQ